jgi:hypothetical protein
MAFTLVIGDVSAYLQDIACSRDPCAYLITADSMPQTLTGTAYASLGDMASIKDFFALLCSADCIIYAPPDKWSDNRTVLDRYSMAWITAYYVNLASNINCIPVENLPVLPSMALESLPNRVSDRSQLWVVGCSTTYGSGVEIGQRYYDIIKDTLNIDCVLLAAPGSSIGWARDQILRADIKKNDIVVWGITSVNRFYWFNNNKINHVGLSYYQEHPTFNQQISFDTLDHPHRLYDALNAINQVINFCRKVESRLLLVGIHANIELSFELTKKANFLMINGSSGLDFDSDYLDYGTDNVHPGVLTHKFYAEKIIDKINKLRWQ